MEKGKVSVVAMMLAVGVMTAAPLWMPMIPGFAPGEAVKACGGLGKIWAGGTCRVNDNPLEGTAL